MYNTTYECDLDDDDDDEYEYEDEYHECSEKLAPQIGMRIIKTAEDGNCFFDTLATYGWAYHYQPLAHSHHELRQIMVDYILDHLDDYSPYIIVKKGKTMKTTIEWLRKDKTYADDMGDLLSQIAADIFKVNIYIYDVDPPIIRRLRANQKPYPEPRPLHMLRIGQHYKLLLPQEDAPHVIGSYASAHKKSKSKTSKTAKTAKNSKNAKNYNNSKNGNSVNKLSHALSKAMISNNHTHKNHKKHGNHTNQMNHQLLKNSQDLQEYEKITVARLHKVLRSLGISEEEIQMSILSLPKKEQKTAYYHKYVSLLS
jgi:hypothetical protein